MHNNNNNNNDNNNQIPLRPKRMYYWVAYLINKVLKVAFETTIICCIFCYRVYIFLSVSFLIFKFFSTDKATSLICSICHLTFLSLQSCILFGLNSERCKSNSNQVTIRWHSERPENPKKDCDLRPRSGSRNQT